jgi:hypothetical protein
MPSAAGRDSTAQQKNGGRIYPLPKRPAIGRIATKKTNCRFAVFSVPSTALCPPTSNDNSGSDSTTSGTSLFQQKTTVETFQARIFGVRKDFNRRSCWISDTSE